MLMRILDSNQYINEKLAIKPITRERLADYKEPEADETVAKIIKNNRLE